MADLMKIVEEWEREQANKKHTWRNFFPGLNPEDWQITETEYGVYGKKVNGKLAGTIAFYISRERLAAGPLPQQRQPESWEFRKVRIGGDTWLVDPHTVTVRDGQLFEVQADGKLKLFQPASGGKE